MGVKKATKPQRSIRYLLSADRKLQKLSLKRVSELKKGKQPARAIPSKNSAELKLSSPPQWAMSWPAIGAGVICVVAAAALITAGQPSDAADVAAAQAPRATTASPASVQGPARLETTKNVASTAPAARAVSRTPAADVSTSEAKPTEPVKAPAESTVASVTITGCVERDGATFWLNDTSGTEAPKARSWKSGFLKKRPSRIELVDATNTLRLSNNVGQRVAVTGVLANREMRARSLRSTAGSCN